MRVELIYAPGCRTYKKALDVLETVIAEERLPIPVELSDQGTSGSEPVIRIDGCEFAEANPTPGIPCLEGLRSLLSSRWRELTLPAY